MWLCLLIVQQVQLVQVSCLTCNAISLLISYKTRHQHPSSHEESGALAQIHETQQAKEPARHSRAGPGDVRHTASTGAGAGGSGGTCACLFYSSGAQATHACRLAAVMLQHYPPECADVCLGALALAPHPCWWVCMCLCLSYSPTHKNTTTTTPTPINQQPPQNQAWLKSQVTTEVLRAIHTLQHPKDCAAARKLVCDLTVSCGFGCQVHCLVQCLNNAIALNRTLVLKVGLLFGGVSCGLEPASS